MRMSRVSMALKAVSSLVCFALVVAALTFSVGGAASAVGSVVPGDPPGAGSSGPVLLPLSTESSNSYPTWHQSGTW
jgi:hypothetical protein